MIMTTQSRKVLTPRLRTVPAAQDGEYAELDQIRCALCRKLQAAKIYPDRKKNKKMHKCIGCGHVNMEQDWDSVQD